MNSLLFSSSVKIVFKSILSVLLLGYISFDIYLSGCRVTNDGQILIIVWQSVKILERRTNRLTMWLLPQTIIFTRPKKWFIGMEYNNLYTGGPSALNLTRITLKTKPAAYAIFFCCLDYAGDFSIYPLCLQDKKYISTYVSIPSLNQWRILYSLEIMKKQYI